VKYNSTGNLLWERTYSTTEFDALGLDGLNVDSRNNVLVVGETEGNLKDTNAGETDAFVIKISP
jgi:hypothetical protein